MGIIFRPGVWLRHLRTVVSTLLPKVLEYSSMAAPIYASWDIDTDTYYGKKIQIRYSCSWDMMSERHD
jgi:hypothetical protein